MKITFTVFIVSCLLLTACTHNSAVLPDGTKFSRTSLGTNPNVGYFLIEKTGEHTGKLELKGYSHQQQEAIKALLALVKTE